MHFCFARLFTIATAIAVLAAAGQAFALNNASQKSAVVLPAEGNVQCNDYASNSVILSMSTSNVPANAGEPPKGLSGPDDPDDAGLDGEKVNYFLDAAGSTITSYLASTLIDYVILKSGKEINIFMYAAGGVTGDSNLALASGNPISAVSFCYGLSGVSSNVELPDCGITGGLDETVIMCPENTRAFICNFEPDKPFFGLDDDNCCFCNHGQTTQCDPNLPVGVDGACPEMGSDLIEVPSLVEAVKNPGTFYCITLGGRRTCYSD